MEYPEANTALDSAASRASTVMMTPALLRIGPPLRHAWRTIDSWIPLARIGRIFPDGGRLVNALVVASPPRCERPCPVAEADHESRRRPVHPDPVSRGERVGRRAGRRHPARPDPGRFAHSRPQRDGAA